VNVYPFFRSFLFRLDPERAHQLTLNLVYLVGKNNALTWLVYQLYTVQGKSVNAFGLEFKNPVGLAAGYDKDGTGWKGLACLGFWHIEIGTVTPNAQVGNPKPRIFRLKEDKALINRMGFPGSGEEFVLQRIHGKKPDDLVLGVNIGKNKDTPVELAAEDYLKLVNAFSESTDYLTVNISSPNTVGLRRLQEKRALENLLNQLQAERGKLTQAGKKKPPMLVKLAPDLNEAELDDALEVILGNEMDGVIATNTTLSRDGLKSSLAIERGIAASRCLNEAWIWYQR
jgi:dihydroorotate dehydrogenase